MKSLFICLTIFLANTCFYGQIKNYNYRKIKNSHLVEKIKLDKTKPSVYIGFDHTGEGDPIYAGDSKQRIWLKLVNNTKWSIYVGQFVFGDDEKLGVFYEVEREKNEHDSSEIPKGYRPGDARSPDVELKAGKFVIFSVPKNHLTDNLKIRIRYSYEWEDNKEIVNTFSEPFHYIYFSHSDLRRYIK